MSRLLFIPVRIAAASLLLLAACSGGGHMSSSHPVPAAPRPPPSIELLGFPDCPDTPVMRARLLAALISVDPSWTCTDTDQAALPADDPRRAYPAPTVLCSGRDLFGLVGSAAPSLSCRLYPGGLPSADELAARIRDCSQE